MRIREVDLAAPDENIEGTLSQTGRLSTAVVLLHKAVEDWHAVIEDPTYADAILDRLVHNAHSLKLSGESIRKHQSNPQGKVDGAKRSVSKI
jgi:hypothetical protein